jgi:hypothetical protein
MTTARTGSLLWVQGLICGAMLAFATGAALLLGILLAPAGVALLADTQPGRPVARAVALGCSAFALGPVWRLWSAGGTMQAALDALATPSALIGPWLAGACGWALCELLPVLVKVALDARAAARIAALRAEEARFRAEWDL